MGALLYFPSNSGSANLPFLLASKCRCAPVDFPMLPTVAIYVKPGFCHGSVRRIADFDAFLRARNDYYCLYFYQK